MSKGCTVFAEEWHTMDVNVLSLHAMLIIIDTAREILLFVSICSLVKLLCRKLRALLVMSWSEPFHLEAIV
jgi:hypothetical protein